MKNMYIKIGIVSLVLLGGMSVLFMTNNNTADDQKQSLTAQEASSNTASAQTNSEDGQLMRFVEKDAVEYKNALSFEGQEYDQYFIANMIHYSEGLAELETLAIKSTNPTTSTGASERSVQARADVAMYKKLQKDMGQLISYGNEMQYHAAMGADSEVYFSLSSLNGLSGTEFETKLSEQLEYFRQAETLLSGAGINNASDARVNELVITTLKNNAVLLERI